MAHVVSCSTLKKQKQTQSSPSLLIVSVDDSEHKCELALTAMALQRSWAESMVLAPWGNMWPTPLAGWRLSYARYQSRCQHVRQVLNKLALLCARTVTHIDWSGRM